MDIYYHLPYFGLIQNTQLLPYSSLFLSFVVNLILLNDYVYTYHGQL